MAYLNAHDGYKAQDWAYDNLDLMIDYTHIIGGTRFAENTVTWHCSSTAGEVTEHYYNLGVYYAWMNSRESPRGTGKRVPLPKAEPLRQSAKPFGTAEAIQKNKQLQGELQP